MPNPYEPRYTGNVDPRGTFEDLQRRASQRITLPILVVTNPDNVLEQPAYAPEPDDSRRSPPQAPRGPRPQGDSPPRSDSPPRHDSPPRRALPPRPLPRPTITLNEPRPRAATRPATAPVERTAPPAPRDTLVLAGPVADSRPVARPTAPPPPRPPKPPALCASTREPGRSQPASGRAAPVLAPSARANVDQARPAASPPKRTREAPAARPPRPTREAPAAPPTASNKPSPPTPSRSADVPHDLFLAPGGGLHQEHQLAPEFIGYQIRCRDIPHMGMEDWRRLSELLEKSHLPMIQGAWLAAASALTGLPPSSQQAGVLSLCHSMVVYRERARTEPIVPMLRMLPQLPVVLWNPFAGIAMVGMDVSGIEHRHLPRFYRALVDAMPVLEPVMASKVAFAPRTYLAQVTCIVAAEVSAAREVTVERRGAGHEPCLPLDEDGLRRILELTLAQHPPVPSIDARGVRATCRRLLALARVPGPLPLELLPPNRQQDGRRVAETLFAELQHRFGGKAPPSASAAVDGWWEMRRRAAEWLGAEPQSEHEDSPLSSPVGLSQFKSYFGRLFDEHGWPRP